MQSLWFCFAFTRLTGNRPGLGRIDQLLGPYLDADLAAGRLTEEEAREILASFFIKGCEWIQSHTPRGSGDAQHYQNIVLGGIDREGCVITNRVTYLILDVVEELSISDYPITVRLSEKSPERLMCLVSQSRDPAGAPGADLDSAELRGVRRLCAGMSHRGTVGEDGCRIRQYGLRPGRYPNRRCMPGGRSGGRPDV